MKYSKMHMQVLSWLLLQLVFSTGILCYESHVYYVKPSDDNQCPNTPCYTFEHYLQSSKDYFQSNTIFHFLQGSHRLGEIGSVYITAVKNLVFTGFEWQNFTTPEPLGKLPVVINCTAKFGMSFVNSESVVISNITFNFCGTEFLFQIPTVSVIYFLWSSDIVIADVTIQNSTGFGFALILYNIVGNSKIVRSKFSFNKGNSTHNGGNVLLDYNIPSEYCSLGDSDITINASEFKAGDSVLPDAIYTGFQIIIYHVCVSINININNVTMLGNSRKYATVQSGGNLGVSILEPENATGYHHIIISNTHIENGIAEYGGGISFAVRSEENKPLCNSISQTLLHTLVISSTLITGNSAAEVGGGLAISLVNVCQIYNFKLSGVILQNNIVLAPLRTLIPYFCGNMDVSVNINVPGPTILLMLENSTIESGGAKSCGGLHIMFSGHFIKQSYITNFRAHIKNTWFIKNVGQLSGALGIRISFTSEATVFDTDPLNSTCIVTVENCTFENNTGILYGSSVGITSNEIGRLQAPIIFHAQFHFENVLFHQNNVNKKVSTHTLRDITAVVYLHGVENITFSNCQFSDNSATAVQGYYSNIRFSNLIVFYNNRGWLGGAISLRLSYLQPKINSKMYFINNHAARKGGAIYLEQLNSDVARTLCFLQPTIPINYSIDETNITAYFANNTAGIAGSMLYGGNIDGCALSVELRKPSGNSMFDMFDHVFIYKDQIGLSVIASDPNRVCFCVNAQPECSKDSLHIEVFPGDSFNVSAVLVGQRDGVVPGVVHAKLTDGEGSLDNLQYSQLTNQTCTNLTYSVFSNRQKEFIELSTDQQNLLFGDRYIAIHLRLPCPLGFILLGIKAKCTCVSVFIQQGYVCDTHTETIHRPKEVWIGCSQQYNNNTRLNTSITTLSDDICGVLLHLHCPLGYCKQKVVKLNLKFPDLQCAFNHSGVLCGKCQEGLSLALGSSQCLKCSNTYLTLLVPFSIAGLVLVMLLSYCNLTVSEGTLNGLILYANIIQVSRSAFLPQSQNNVLTIFVAWLNLDLGIETCFYNGMDMYAKAWLQLTFPLYIWAIVAVMIVLSRYYILAARVTGQNAPKVLATLFLLSYAKLLRAVITILSFTYLVYPDGHSKLLWLYDGNVEYLKGKHSTLFVAAILTLTVFLIPYTFVVLFMQCLRRKSGYRLLAWVRRLKPVLDAYSGPYKDRYQFWSGLLLVVRVLLFLAFAFNVSGNPALNLFLIVISALFLLSILIFFSGVYSRSSIDILESSFFINMATLAAATLYVQLVGGDSQIPTLISMGIAIISFVLIFIYHFYKYTRICKVCRKLRNRKSDRIPMNVINSPANNELDIEYRELQQQPIQPPAHGQNQRLTFDDNGELMLVTDN